MSRDLITLTELYQSRLFRIPDYQRGYAWKHEHLSAFWDDLINLQECRDHYTGLLSLKAVRNSSYQNGSEPLWIPRGYQLYHVVDGQQRLTTIAILLYEITVMVRKLPENEGKADNKIVILDATLENIVQQYICMSRPPDDVITTYLFGYEIDNPSEMYLRHIIFEDTKHGTIPESYYTHNLDYAKEFFRDNLRREYQNYGMQGIERLYDKLTQHLMFNLHDIKDEYDVFVAFETMNNRGKKLTNLELLKNRLIYLTTLYDDERLDEKRKTAFRDLINDTWKEVYYQLGRNKYALLSDDEFLRAHWVLYFQYTRKRGDDYINFLMTKFSAKNIFIKHAYQATPEQAESAELKDDWSDSEDEDAEPRAQADSADTEEAGFLQPIEIWNYVQHLRNLVRHWHDSYFPEENKKLSQQERTWIDRLNRVRIAYFRPVVAAVLMTAENTREEERIGLYAAIERFIFLSFRMAEYRSNYLQSHFYTEIRRFLSGEIRLSEITEDLNDRVNSDLPNILSAFIARNDRRFDSGDGFYAWRPGLMYFLYEYESNLADEKGLKKIDWQSFTKYEAEKISVEHIFPQTPKPHYWRNQFRGYSDQEKKQLSGSLGNLLPLAEGINKSLQNDSFPEKKAGIRRRGYDSGSHSEIEVSKHEHWSPMSIYERGLQLLRFLESRWNIAFSDEQRRKLLHIEFVNDGREIGDALPTDIENGSVPYTQTSHGRPLHPFEIEHLAFWNGFVGYCNSIGRPEIAARKAAHYDTYDFHFGRNGCFVRMQIYRRAALRIGFCFSDTDAYVRLASKRSDFEEAYGAKLNWDVGRSKTMERRAMHEISADLQNSDDNAEYFQWLVTHSDKLIEALRKTIP